LEHDGKIFLFLGEGQHKIKRKAEQIACNEALQSLNLNENEENNKN
jgi:dsRNA-specific ribonuclease